MAPVAQQIIVQTDEAINPLRIIAIEGNEDVESSGA